MDLDIARALYAAAITDGAAPPAQGLMSVNDWLVAIMEAWGGTSRPSLAWTQRIAKAMEDVSGESLSGSWNDAMLAGLAAKSGEPASGAWGDVVLLQAARIAASPPVTIGNCYEQLGLFGGPFTYPQTGIDSSGDMTWGCFIAHGNMQDLDLIPSNLGAIVKHLAVSAAGRLRIQLNWALGYTAWINSPDGAITQNEWSHLAVTITAATRTAEVWLDAVSLGTVTGTSDYPATPSGNGAIGRPLFGNRFDQLFWYDRKLSAAEIAQHAAGKALTGSEPGLMMLYGFDEAPGAGNTCIDSAQGYNGTITGTEGADWQRSEGIAPSV